MRNYDHKKIEKKWPSSAKTMVGKQKEYNHLSIEKFWQKEWEKKKIYEVKNGTKGKTFVGLIEFPYPSGAGLHVGHIRSNTAMDIITRKRRMEGYNVLYPIGWDAFGLPTENYAIKTGIQPEKVTKTNTNVFRKQLKSIGFGFDWSREINTTDPGYYKWTQWIFLQLYKKGLAYKAKTSINWCPSCKIGLANEEVVGGECERCGTETTKKVKEQWMLAITKYADRLDKDLDKVNYLEKIKIQQRNWIGKSEGSELDFKIKDLDLNIKVFTTRADTIFGATYVVIAPEHELVTKLINNDQLLITNKEEVKKYIAQVKDKKDIERTAEEKEKTGVELKGVMAINPATGGEVPVWIADYVLATYGTGSVMSVPAHDERDFLFAKKYNLPIKQVIEPLFINKDINYNLGFVERNAISAVIKHWSEDKYLCLKWKKADWMTFVTGGVEKGQTPEQAARAEILEETGFLNLDLVQTLPCSHSKFYHIPKKENRFAHFSNFYFKLNNGEQQEVSKEEKEKHEIIWLKKEEIEKLLTPVGQKNDFKIVNGPENAYTDYGILNNSAKFNGLESTEAIKEINKAIGGKIVTKFKLRDWVFSRQRYWGEPIPMIHCDKCGIVPVPEKDLPVLLPKVKSYKPTDSGESPLAIISKWVNTKCPVCKGKAKRETDTMPNWAGSSWYYLRYADPKNKKELASKDALKYWMKNGVDWYNGGMEHTTLHLLYSRFWHKFLYDLKVVPTSEPYMKRTSHGMILAEGGVKMSKSIGNTIDPKDIVETYGADTLRIYEMFIGPFDQTVSWSTESIIGSRRFIEKVWRQGVKVCSQKSNIKSSPSFVQLLHKTIKKITEDIESMSFNTAISSMMVLVNEMEKTEGISTSDFKMFLQILSPFAPHVSEEIWQKLGEKQSINKSSWPRWDNDKIIDETIKIVIQINGKVRAELMIDRNISEEEAKKLAVSHENILSWIKDKEIRRIIYIPHKVINIVV